MTDLERELLTEVERVERDLLPTVPRDNGVAFQLVSKALKEARAQVEGGSPDQQRFYLGVLRRAGLPK